MLVQRQAYCTSLGDVSTEQGSGEETNEAPEHEANTGKSHVVTKADQQQSTADKRITEIVASLIGTAVSAGTSLAGTTAGALASTEYSITVSGALENYSKFDLTKVKCKNINGYINKALPAIHSGIKEGFASHQGAAHTGSFVHCSMKATGSKDSMIHFSYSAPNNFDLYSNQLALAVCSMPSKECKNLNAQKMYYETYPFMTRGEFYYGSDDLFICNDQICLSGKMGTSHKSEISIRVYAKKLKDANEKIRSSFKEHQKTSADYDDFIKSYSDDKKAKRRRFNH